VELANPKAYCGQTVTFHVSADNVTGLNVQPYASANNWSWFAGTGVTLTAINSWTAVTFTLPATINFLGLQAFGLQLSNTSTNRHLYRERIHRRGHLAVVTQGNPNAGR